MPNRPVLTANGFEVAVPVLPVPPELPDAAAGFDVAVDTALPVSPVLVALDCDDEGPESPETANGAPLNVARPPAPPLAVPAEMLVPPAATPAVETLPPDPPLPDPPDTIPPVPPEPPKTLEVITFSAPPVLPETDDELADAPELATLVALPLAVAAPVSPLEPLDPDTTDRGSGGNSCCG